MRVKNNKNVSRVPVGLSLQLRHLHQYAGRTCWEIAKMKSYKNFFKVAICKHTNENTTNLVVHIQGNIRESCINFQFDGKEI